MEGDPFLIRLLLQAWRFLVFHCAMVLESSHDLARRETWFTVAALKQQLAMFGYASARQVDHLLALLQEVGFIEQRRAPSDGRVRLLATTDRLRSHQCLLWVKRRPYGCKLSVLLSEATG
jgi:hypothetical protein